MTNVIALPVPAGAEPDKVAALEAQIGALTGIVGELVREREASNARFVAIEARLPPIALPDNWISVKEASAISNYSAPALYRFCRLGLIDSRPMGGRVAIDSSTLARRLAEHFAKRKKIK